MCFILAGGESGDITPVSGSSDVECDNNEVTAGSISTEFDVTVTEDIDMEHSQVEESIDPNETLTSDRLNALANIINASTNVNIIENNLFQPVAMPKLISPMAANVNICTNQLTDDFNFNLRHVENIERLQPSTSRAQTDFDRKDLKNIMKQSNIFEKDIPNPNSVNITSLGSDKWSTSKEKFLENKNYGKVDNIMFGKNLNTSSTEKKVEKESELSKSKAGAVIIKESYIEPPRISRVSKSFHGKSPASGSYLDISATPRRASDSPISEAKNMPISLQDIRWDQGDKAKTFKKPPFLAQLSQPTNIVREQPRKPSLPEPVSFCFLTYIQSVY